MNPKGVIGSGALPEPIDSGMADVVNPGSTPGAIDNPDDTSNDTAGGRDRKRSKVEVPMPVNPDQPGEDYPPDPLPVGDPPADKPEIRAGTGPDAIDDGEGTRTP